MAKDGICSVAGCGNTKRITAGLCSLHYQRLRRNGDPLKTKIKATPRGEVQAFFAQTVLTWATDECLPWPYTTPGDGRGYMRHQGRWGIVSRFACEEAHGPPPTPEHEAAHSCGNASAGCVSPRHLRWATRAENEADKVGHGTSQHGERNAQAKLSGAEVAEIRALKGSASQSQIAARFGITQSAVSMIQRGLRWGP